MNEYLSQVNAGYFYLIVALVLTFITVMCFVFLVKSYRAGVKLGMDQKVLRKTITASATFTLLPSISILLGGSFQPFHLSRTHQPDKIWHQNSQFALSTAQSCNNLLKRPK